MKPNLYSLEGSQLLPKELNRNDLHAFHGDIGLAYEDSGYNKAVNQLKPLAIVIDSDILILMSKEYGDRKDFIRAICANPAKIIKIVRGEE